MTTEQINKNCCLCEEYGCCENNKPYLVDIEFITKNKTKKWACEECLTEDGFDDDTIGGKYWTLMNAIRVVEEWGGKIKIDLNK